MLLRILLLLLGLGTLAQAQESFYGTLIKREADQLTVRSAQTTESFSVMKPATVPAWVKPGVKLQVDFERLRVAVMIPNGGRGCLNVNKVVQLRPWNGTRTSLPKS